MTPTQSVAWLLSSIVAGSTLAPAVVTAQVSAGDTVVVRVDKAPCLAGTKTVREVAAGTSLRVEDVNGSWLRVRLPAQAVARQAAQSAWIHQNHVTPPDAPAKLGGGPVPIANLGQMPLDASNLQWIMNPVAFVQAAISSGRERELLRHEKQLLAVFNVPNAQQNPIAPLMQSQAHSLMGDLYRNVGQRTRATAYFLRAYDLASAGERRMAASEATPRAGGAFKDGMFRIKLLETMGTTAWAVAKTGSLREGEPRLAAVTGMLDGIFGVQNDGSLEQDLKDLSDKLQKIGYPIDGRVYTRHADLLLKQNRTEPAERQLRKALVVDSLFAKWADGMKLNASGTAGWPESLTAVCSAATGDLDGAFSWMDAAQREYHRYLAWSGHLEDPTWELYVREDREAHLSDSFDYGISLAAAFPSHPGAASLSAAWILNRKLKQEELLQRQMAIVRDAPPDANRYHPLQASIHGDSDYFGMATTNRIVSLRGMTADFALRRFTDHDRPEAHREFELVRQVAAALKSARLVVELDIPENMTLAQWHKREAERTWVDVPQVQSCLQDGQVLIEFVRYRAFDFASAGERYRWGDDRFVAWIVPAEGDVVLVDLGPVSELTVRIRRVRDEIVKATGPQGALAVRGEAEAITELAPAMSSLAETLLEPLRPHIDGHAELILSPDDSLWLAPWAALPWTSEEFLLERFALRFVPTGRGLIHGEGRDLPLGDPVIIADPDFDLPLDQVHATEVKLLDGELPASDILAYRRGSSRIPRVVRLPFTRSEAEQIAPQLAAYAGATPRIYLGAEAIEGVVLKLQRPRVLVLATHGFFLPANPLEEDNAPLAIRDPTMRCGVLLAGVNRRDDRPTLRGADGVLTGYEVAGLDLAGTELVVLSACETGLGDLRAAEGVTGLTQAFRAAGARAVVATLWQVPDRDTAQIMVAFFENLAAGQSQSAALREAQLARIQDRRLRYGAAHPFFWAAPTLTE